MPGTFKQKMKAFLVVITLLVLISAFVIVHEQRPFLNSTFELGKLTEHEGILSKEPVPMLSIKLGENARGEEIYQSVMLVAFGKNGAEDHISTWESQAGTDLHGKRVKLRGSLIYYDGKSLLELTEGLKAMISVEKKGETLVAEQKSLGKVSIKGEIIDPKCYFGVMKPGMSKPHRSCAIRCIAGGIPPVFKAVQSEQRSEYYLLRSTNGDDLHESLLDRVGEQISLKGELKQWGNWYILEI